MERMGRLAPVVYESRGVTFTPDDLEWGTLGVLVDRYGDPTEGAPEILPPLQVLVGERRGCERSAPFDADGAGA